jgi:hypothetical protein
VRSKMTIMGIVLGVMLLSLGILAALMLTLGPWPGLGLGMGITVVVLTLYLSIVQPCQHRWGATEEEAGRAMPGDDVIPGAKSTTRAITIRATPRDVWPWLVQIGYGRAGWYSYDWIDNDGRPSAERIIPEFQDLRPGDRIVMVPGMGPIVKAMEPNEWLLSGDQESGTWCLALYPRGDGSTRLVSRWRQNWTLTPATAFWILISDPGAFVMERKMLKGIKARAEQLASPRGNGADREHSYEARPAGV